MHMFLQRKKNVYAQKAKKAVKWSRIYACKNQLHIETKACGKKRTPTITKWYQKHSFYLLFTVCCCDNHRNVKVHISKT